jgi:hypothetical protein
MLSYFPEDKVTFSMITNGINMNANDIGIAVLSWTFGEPFEVPDFKSAYNYTSRELDVYLGDYESADIPLGIAITKEVTTLMAQATGQSAFPLEATAKDKFKFDMAGIVMEFSPAEKKMVLKQGGAVYTFTKK